MNALAMTLLIAWACAAIAQLGAWWWQRMHGDAGIVDVVWAATTGASALLAAWLGEGALLPRILLALAGGAWGFRLAWHLWRRTQGGAEDGRYAYLRKHWRNAQWKWFLFFQAQALLVVLFALPFAAVAANPVPGMTAWLVAGIAVWAVGVAGESLADRQLARFRSDPANAGKTCRLGLWRYSRHPNYFFEWLHWFGYVLFAVGSPLFWMAWLGPAVMYGFLRYISGIPYTEAQALRTRGDDYRDYQQGTSMLIPWFPKRTPLQTRSNP